MSEITKALNGFHKAVDKIEKNARANYGKFADLANVLSTVTPALHANNLVLTQTFLENSLVTTLHHTSGETISSSCPLVTCEGRNQTQEWGKAVTYQRRFSICSILGIVADMDTDDVEGLKHSQAFHAGANAIKAAKSIKELSAINNRIKEREKEKHITPHERDQLLTMLFDKELAFQQQQKSKTKAKTAEAQ